MPDRLSKLASVLPREVGDVLSVGGIEIMHADEDKTAHAWSALLPSLFHEQQQQQHHELGSLPLWVKSFYYLGVASAIVIALSAIALGLWWRGKKCKPTVSHAVPAADRPIQVLGTNTPAIRPPEARSPAARPVSQPAPTPTTPPSTPPSTPTPTTMTTKPPTSNSTLALHAEHNSCLVETSISCEGLCSFMASVVNQSTDHFENSCQQLSRTDANKLAIECAIMLADETRAQAREARQRQHDWQVQGRREYVQETHHQETMGAAREDTTWHDTLSKLDSELGWIILNVTVLGGLAARFLLYICLQCCYGKSVYQDIVTMAYDKIYEGCPLHEASATNEPKSYAQTLFGVYSWVPTPTKVMEWIPTKVAEWIPSTRIICAAPNMLNASFCFLGFLSFCYCFPTCIRKVACTCLLMCYACRTLQLQEVLMKCGSVFVIIGVAGYAWTQFTSLHYSRRYNAKTPSKAESVEMKSTFHIAKKLAYAAPFVTNVFILMIDVYNMQQRGSPS